MCSELSVTVKDDDKRMTKKFLLYDPYYASETDPLVQKCIKETIKEFGDEPDDVRVKIVVEVK